MEQIRQDLRIEGEQIYLRPIKEEDTDIVLEWRNSPEVVKNFIYRKPISREEHLDWLHNKVEKGLVHQFVVCDKETDEPLGCVYLQNIDMTHRKAESGVFFSSRAQKGKGYATEAGKLLLHYAFYELGLHKVMARVLAYNQASIRVHEKMGGAREAYLKDELFLEGSYVDEVLFGFSKESADAVFRTVPVTRKKVSFVIPCYRSAKTLEAVVREIQEAMDKLTQYSYDIILVNDCSPDDTFDVIRKLCRENRNIMGIDFARNFGQHAALMAGLRKSDGDIVVCLDDDGQTPANEVGKLLDGLEQGHDVVYASYGDKKHSAFRNFGTWMNDIMTRVLLGKPKDLHVTSYFAAKRYIVDSMLLYENSYPYLIGLVLRATKNIVNVPVKHRSREVGTSGYTMKKLLGLWLNGFTAFSITPLRAATVAGAVFAACGFLYGIYTVIKKLVNPTVPMGFSSTMSAIVFIGGMLMIMLGLIGEYIGRIYISINHSPQYVIKEEVGEKQE